MTGILISMISTAVITAIGEEVSIALQKPEYAKWIKVGGVSLTAGLGIGLVTKLISQVSKAFN